MVPTPSQRPRIGLTLDAEPPGGYSRLPWYALRENYFAAIARAGGLPIALPHDPLLVDDWLELLDGEAERHPTVRTKDRRTAFEFAITRAALARNQPVFGICGGQQLLNVVLGGDLVQHIPDAMPGALAHEQPNPRTEPGHEVEVLPGSRLHAIAGVTRLRVNSAHHQAAGRVGAGVVVSGRAPDGVIEAIEAPARRFCIGVQWHPEYAISAADEALFEALIAACRSL